MPFEDDIGDALRRTGGSFDTDDCRGLVDGGLSRGRRRLARRRAVAVAGSVMALAIVGVGSAYGGGLLGGDSGGGRGSTMAAPKPVETGQREEEPGKGAGATAPDKDLVKALVNNTPKGVWSIDDSQSAGRDVSGIYDDGHGRAAVAVGLNRLPDNDPKHGEAQITCPDKVLIRHDGCTSEKLADGSRLMMIKGYEYPGRTEGTKTWRAALLTKDGFLLEAAEHNAEAEKGAEVTRDTPPFTLAQLKSLVTAADWRPLLARLPRTPEAGRTSAPGSAGRDPQVPSGKAVQSTLRSLLPQGLSVTAEGGNEDWAYAVVDDGKGKSLVQINVQPGMDDVAKDLFGGGDVTTLPDGTMVKLEKKPGEKGAEGVVWWTVDTLRPDGLRVVVSAFNSGAQHESATRAEPALTMEQLKALALSEKWL